MKYTIFDGELVSLPWATVCRDMRADGVWFNVNEGHRTMARQWYFWNCYQTKRCNNGNIAAYPSAFAPHIRTGRPDHAMDFSNDPAVFAWLSRKGLRPVRTVRWPSGAVRESWHIEVSLLALLSYYHAHNHDKWDTLPKHVEHAVRKLFYHRRQAIEEAKPENGGKGPQYRRHVKWRNWWRRRVEGMLRRARRDRTKRLLRLALEPKTRR